MDDNIRRDASLVMASSDSVVNGNVELCACQSLHADVVLDVVPVVFGLHHDSPRQMRLRCSMSAGLGTTPNRLPTLFHQIWKATACNSQRAWRMIGQRVISLCSRPRSLRTAAACAVPDWLLPRAAGCPSPDAHAATPAPS